MLYMNDVMKIHNRISVTSAKPPRSAPTLIPALALERDSMNKLDWLNELTCRREMINYDKGKN